MKILQVAFLLLFKSKKHWSITYLHILVHFGTQEVQMKAKFHTSTKKFVYVINWVICVYETAHPVFSKYNIIHKHQHDTRSLVLVNMTYFDAWQ